MACAAAAGHFSQLNLGGFLVLVSTNQKIVCPATQKEAVSLPTARHRVLQAWTLELGAVVGEPAKMKEHSRGPDAWMSRYKTHQDGI